MNIGEQVLNKLKLDISIQIWERYIKHLKYDDINSNMNFAQFFAPNLIVARWIKSKFGDKLAHFFELELQVKPVIHITTGSSLEVSEAKKMGAIEAKSSLKSTILNPSFTFDSFIVGESNQFAYNASKRVTEQPGVVYNPLFLYGGVGLGKTHLLHAIGNHFVGLGKTVIYTSLEQFMNKFTSHIRSNSMEKFREIFRECDLLLIDDIQFLTKKEHTQDEFFHTFNELHQANKQIVVSSDRQPKDMVGLVDRIKSRFEWGLMASIEPPQLNTKIAIIEKKCELDGITLAKEIVHSIATKMGTNIREIEGVLIKINAYSGLMNQKITQDFVNNIIKDQLLEKQSNIDIDDIVQIIAKEMNIKLSDIRSKKRNKEIVNARRMAIHLARDLTPNSMPQIAQYFGMKDHTAISHALKKIAEAIEEEPNFQILLEELSNKISSISNKLD
ncbi:MAG: chromosomal replication initiator protein DnaA [Epsilonproteobacteria bacterium]|nr:chromosomal replication initiator protein DnaA [Campylobacterota bacterium]MBD3839986.1 chromosomal replication initiator protein DnaA [Campylobacterota bacterium]